MTNPGISAPHPDPGMIFSALNSYQRSMALKTAIELDVFSAIGRGETSVEAIAKAAGASERGIRILCDFLVIEGFLTKTGVEYGLPPHSAMFLDKSSRAYLGSTANFILDPQMIDPFLKLTEVVRTGRTTMPDEGSVSDNNPLWVGFAREMMPMMVPAAMEIAELVAGDGPLQVLDIAAGHGIYGIMVAKQNPRAEVTALDWPSVLAVATENAGRFGVAERHRTRPGSVFEGELGGPYDLVMVTGFFHHFDKATCEGLMAKVRAALAPGGRLLTLDFVPNEDRVSPVAAASFAMTMLGTTAAGDAYTYAEYEGMLRGAGYTGVERHDLKRNPQTVILSWG